MGRENNAGKQLHSSALQCQQGEKQKQKQKCLKQEGYSQNTKKKCCKLDGNNKHQSSSVVNRRKLKIKTENVVNLGNYTKPKAETVMKMGEILRRKTSRGEVTMEKTNKKCCKRQGNQTNITAEVPEKLEKFGRIVTNAKLT